MNNVVFKVCYLKKREDSKVTIVTNKFLEMFFLDKSATRVLNLISAGYTIVDIIKIFFDEYESVEYTKIQEDIMELIVFLQENYLIETSIVKENM